MDSGPQCAYGRSAAQPLKRFSTPAAATPSPPRRATLTKPQTANYRQSVLNAFQEVEDNLAALRILNDEAATADRRRQRRRASLAISTNRYKGGVTTYLEVLTAQTTQLTNQRTQADITTRQFAASVQLIKALGGGWDTSQLPTM